MIEFLSSEGESSFSFSSSDDEISFSREVLLEEHQGGSSSKHGSKMSFIYRPSIGKWVEVPYDGEIYTCVVIAKEDDEWKIRCLTYLPNGSYHLESDAASVWCTESDILGRCDNMP